MADKVEVTGSTETATGAEGPKFGLPQAMALIIGSIIGVGIFNLPTSLAAYGPITLISMALTTVGALALALLFAALSRRLPADGGPYAYARVAFGNGLGFANAWSYWITAWAGNAAIAVGWVLYVEHFINKGQNKLITVLLVLVGLWLPAAVNLSGVKNIGSVQVITTIIKFAAVAVVSIVGLFFISSANFTPWNVSGESAINAIGGGVGIAPVSYLRRGPPRGRRARVGQPRPKHPAGHHPGHDRHRSRLHTLARRGVRHRAHRQAGQRDRPVLRRGQRDVRRHLGGQRDGRRGHHLRSRGTERLDDDLRRDAAGRPGGRLVPATVQAHLEERGARVRHRRLHRARLDRDGHQLPGVGRRDGVYHPGADDRHHRRHPVRLLRARADQVALDRPE